MKLQEISLFESTVEIYHSTSGKKFGKFKSQPSWFATNKKDALNWHKNQPKSVTYTCSFSGKIVAESKAANFAKEIWPDHDLIYSMYDQSIGEYPRAEVKAFIKLLQDAGFDAAYIVDYDPADFNVGSSKSLCVFDPADNVKITGILQDDQDA